MQANDFYQTHLNKVSRSFAFCIARLKGQLRQWVGLSYLLCRVLDTVEDIVWSCAEDKKKAFEQFELFLLSMPTTTEVQAWEKSIPSCPKKEERELLQDFYLLLADFHALPEAVRIKLRKSIINMKRGMQHFSAQNNVNEIRLQSLEEVNQYCFFVAGVVGELLTDLFYSYRLDIKMPENIYLKSHQFGLFLQKINLLKDQKEDEKEGRFLVPDRQELLWSLKKDAAGAIEYLTSIPVEEREYRLFCAWSLFLGLFSLPWIQKSWMLGVFSKVPRVLTETFLHSVEKIIDDNHALLLAFREQMQSIGGKMNPKSNAVFPSWFFNAYDGTLSATHCKEIGIT